MGKVEIGMSKRDKIYLRVVKGALVPADFTAENQLRERRYRIGDLLSAEITKPRNPKFNRLLHALGRLVTENIDSFAGMDAHKAIKRLQIEGKIACDEIGILIENYGMVVQFIPRSLSYQSMDEGEFQEAARGICRTIAARYWPNVEPEKIEQMAELMVGES